ncbi:MAG: hypothetical protein GY791_11375 [Alphaproteobacteria bacterium]|nr:hypothetical protein [Alphaproteobacteria bacterium]
MTMVPPDRAGRLARAMAYPFAIPPGSFVFRDGAATSLDFADLPSLTRGRMPVIACGSNQSPDQLARKYAGRGDVFPVLRARLRDFDAVYSAHITTYGSVASTLQHIPGTTVALSVLWLDGDQLALMHTTEAPGENYAYTRLEGVRIEVDGGGVLETAWAYTSLHGCLNHDGDMVPLAAMPAENRSRPALEQQEMLGAVHRRLAPEIAFEDFVLENIGDRHIRRRRIGALRADAAPFGWARAFHEI